MKNSKKWTVDVQDTLTDTKYTLAQKSVEVRTDQFRIFERLLKPKKTDKILDVGVSSEELLPDTNMFEKLYPYPAKLTLATVENGSKLKRIYKKSKVVQITPNTRLPFRDKAFDIVVSWATLEHVGGYANQEEFIKELTRVGKKVFLTTPYRGCIYEPHTGFFILHWLPLPIFRAFCKRLGKEFWSLEENLNPLYITDIKKMKKPRGVRVILYKMYKFLPTHLIVYKLK